MHDRTHPSIQRLIALLPNTLSLGYKAAAFCQWRIRSQRPRAFPGLFIVSIDNLAFGGTGKTPLAIHIGAELLRLGMPVALISRGYRSSLEKSGAEVRPDHRAAAVGDEAVLLKRRLPAARVFIGRNRLASLELAEAAGARFALLDDGFQSSHIAKDFRIMLVNPRQPYYLLRHFRFLAEVTDLKLVLGGLMGSTRPERSGGYTFRISGFHRADGTPVPAPDNGIFAFSALGDNSRFAADLAAYGLLGSRGYRDHHPFSCRDLRELDEARRRAGAAYLVCSEKDFVRIDSAYLEEYPFLYCRNEVQLDFDVTRTIICYAQKKGFISDLD